MNAQKQNGVLYADSLWTQLANLRHQLLEKRGVQPLIRQAKKGTTIYTLYQGKRYKKLVTVNTVTLIK